jgi:hypothetical protein
VPPAAPRKRFFWLTLLAMMPMCVFETHDFYCSVTDTGLYRRDYEGRVVKLARTLKYVADLFHKHKDGWRFNDDYDNHGYYSATLRTQSGETIEVGLSYRTFRDARVGDWIVTHDGVTHVEVRME